MRLFPTGHSSTDNDVTSRRGQCAVFTRWRQLKKDEEELCAECDYPRALSSPETG